MRYSNSGLGLCLAGKRINMKKVIAFIASHFRRDKIWMRRTQPDTRKYQVSLHRGARTLVLCNLTKLRRTIRIGCDVCTVFAQAACIFTPLPTSGAQVVLAVDESKSMADNGCGGVAMESVTLIARALARLEVGEIGIVGFGGASGGLCIFARDCRNSSYIICWC